MPTNKNQVAKRNITVSKEVFAKLQAVQFQPQAPVYEQDEVLVTVPSGMYSVESRPVAATATSKAWTAHEAIFKVNGTDFRIRFRSGVTPDEDMDIAIASFTANRNWPSDTEIKIPKGKESIFAVNEG